MTAFPSQALIMQMLDITKPTLLKSIARLEYLGLLSVHRSKKNNSKENNVNVYTIEKIPQFIKDSAKLCKNLANREEVEKLKAIEKEKRKEIEGKKETQPKDENVVSYKFSEEDKLWLKTLAVDLGKDYKLTEKDISALESGGADELAFITRAVDTSKSKLRLSNFLKMYFSFVKANKIVPSLKEIEKLETLADSQELEPKSKAEAIKQAAKQKISILDDAFEKIISGMVQKETETADFWKKKNFKTTTSSSNYRKPEKEFKTTVSDYSVDEDEELYKKLSGLQ
jgi:hypothetical protein